MSGYWLAAAIGAGSGLLLLAFLVRLDAKTIANQGLIALVAMLAIYVGARLVSGSLEEILWETALALAAASVTQAIMLRWPPIVGVAILLHGTYDALVGPHTGVAEWYPPLCAGFDFVVGAGLLVILLRRERAY
ncbi:hypothetical protein [Erythrobacter ani]|uniref:Uncharacterized protein n=1 Tax=Erythrobacter ani TaxID=2827235 RepID=A0ABS6SP24_9SPHN|nr:hypothetical protein [Erythrobacter ani]MBV7266586.1 hypothetical protein [Erythrobacter ani]